MTELNLRECPFCGGDAAWFGCADGYEVRCRNVRCLARSSAFDTLPEAVEAWNARAERTCTVVSSLFDGTMGERCIELSCGHCVWDRTEPPSYCPLCGAKVVDE